MTANDVADTANDVAESYPLDYRRTRTHHPHPLDAGPSLVKRDLAAFSSTTFDVVIVGGGITGACIARDAARRGLSVALLEKGDFSAATSAGSSKLVHGGLRYLKSMELALVRESLRERRIWQRIAPHLVYPVPFLVPAYASRDQWMLRAGLTLYDGLSFDRSWLDDPEQRMGRSRWLPAERIRTLEPILDEPELQGALRYFDCQMYSPERLAIDCLADACAHGAVVANYVEVDAIARDRAGHAVEGVRGRDVLTGQSLAVGARTVVNAAGPWADLLLSRWSGRDPSRRLLRSKGIHVLVPALTEGHALTLAHRGGDAASRGHFFVIPWRGHSLIGTTDVAFDRSLDRVVPTEQDVSAFLEVINRTLPAARLTLADVRFAYAAIRPLIAGTGTSSTYQASRRGEIVDHASELGLRNVISVIGGKWTTSRHAAEDATSLVVRKLGGNGPPCDTAHAPLPGGGFGRFADLQRGAQDARVAPDELANLLRNYGSRYRDVLALVDADPSLRARVTETLPDVAAQVAYAFRSEMAIHLEDAVFRRTGLGTLGSLDAFAMDRLVAIGRHERGWDDAECARQRAAIRARYDIDRT